MTESSAALCSRLEGDVDRLIAKLNDLKADNARLAAEVSRLRGELEFCQAEAMDSRKELECCKLGLALRGADYAESGYTPDEAKRRISQMVRGIDECIALLKQ